MKNFFIAIIFSLLLFNINTQDAQIDQSLKDEIKSYISLNKEEKLLPERNFTRPEKPKISIIIPIYNNQDTLTPTIRSIQNQNLQEIEIICMNDRSNDTSLQILKKLQKEDPRISIIRNKSNRGLLYNLMNGALESNGEYVIFIYPGDYLSNNDALNKLYDIATKDYNKKIDIVNFQSCEFQMNNNDIKINSIISGIDKSNLKNLIKQPDITDNYFNKYKNKIRQNSEIIFDKMYKKILIKRLANYIGPNIWNLYINYYYEYLFDLSNIIKSKSLVYVEDIFYCRSSNNKFKEDFELAEDKLKNPQRINNIFGDYTTIVEKILDLTNKEPKSNEYREYILKKLDEEKILKALSRSIYYDKYLNLLGKLIKWKSIDKDTKERCQQYTKNVLNYEVDPETKFGYMLEEEDEDDDFDDFNDNDYL